MRHYSGERKRYTATHTHLCRIRTCDEEKGLASARSVNISLAGRLEPLGNRTKDREKEIERKRARVEEDELEWVNKNVL